MSVPPYTDLFRAWEWIWASGLPLELGEIICDKSKGGQTQFFQILTFLLFVHEGDPYTILLQS